MKHYKRFNFLLKQKGLKETIRISASYIANKTVMPLMPYKRREKAFLGKNSITGGILQNKTYCGPSMVQIDLTNKCNNSCIGCWLHSPNISEEKKKRMDLKSSLPTKTVMKLISDLKDLGTERILLSGGGEPMSHSGFMDIIQKICEERMECNFITNFTMLNKKKIDKILSLGINELFISLWASNSDAYVKTHPNQKEKVFDKIISDLKYMIKERKRIKKGPRIILLNTISKANYDDVLNMTKLASRIGVDRVEFVTIDIIPGSTEFLKLNKKEIECIKDQIKVIENNSEHNFLKKVSEENKFEEKIGKTELWGFERFKKRIYDYHNKKGFDKNIVDSIPCYVGWIYARIMANGDVIPCCKAHKHPLGNLNKRRLKSIWFSKKYEEFRSMAKNEKKNNPYFKKINCYKGCDNFTENKIWYERIKKLTPKEEKLLLNTKW